MSALVLTEGSKVECNHKGTVAARGVPYFTVERQPVRTRGTVELQSISGCTNPGGNSPPPCLTVAAGISGLATALTAGGAAVVLASVAGSTLPQASGGTLTVTAVNQSILRSE